MGNGHKPAFELSREATYKRAKRRLKEYWNSKEIPLTELTRADSMGDYLRPGDILSRKLAGSGPSQPSGSYSPSGKGGIMVHYLIYVCYLGDNKHRLIDKVDKRSSCIDEYTLDSEELLRHRLVVDSRYPDTLEVALFIKEKQLDGGYSATHANCEHFVTFCLTRWTFTSRSRQACVGTAFRDTGALFSVTIGNIAKFITHPFYMMGGDMKFSERAVKTAVPFGMDDEGIASGKTILIGFSVRLRWDYWIEIDRSPSVYTLHQCESRKSEDDDRIIRHHR